MKSSYRILKLISGEEIITRIIGKDNGKIVVENPMVFKTTYRSDAFGQSKEITFLGDWLSNTNSKITKISEGYIMNWLTPTKEVAHLYDLEQNRKLNNISKPKNPKQGDKWPNVWGPSGPPNVNNDLLDMIDEFVKETKENTDKNEKYVFMHMMLPPDAIKEMMDSGLFDMDDLEEDLFNHFDDGIEEGSYGEVNDDLYTGDDHSHPNFGNRWTDWDPNPFDDDYL
jgi:hypothetical protein